MSLTKADEVNGAPAGAGAVAVASRAKAVDDAFDAKEHAIHGLLLRRCDEDVIEKHLDQMSPEKLKSFNDKRDFKGRTLLVNAIHAHYANLVKKLLDLVNSEINLLPLTRQQV